MKDLFETGVVTADPHENVWITVVDLVMRLWL